MPELQYICVHCHYYQPPRGNPLAPADLIEPDAAPYRNWNARIAAEAYEPNARSGNLEHISFDIGEALAAWLADNTPDIYDYFITADKTNVHKYNVGNAIALPLHHTVLPLDRREDKETQIKWGRALFAHRFGRQTTGMWLPELAVDVETLSIMADQGIEWTILTERQLEGKPLGAGPYWVNLPGGKRIKVFVRDDVLSNDIAFNLGTFGGAGRWARQVLIPRKRDAGTFTLIALDGETFGHHWPGEELFLHWLLTYEAKAAGYEVTTLARHAQSAQPQASVIIRENTAWNCLHGIGRWATGCPCTSGDCSWKGALRRAMDNLRHELDGVFREEVKRIDGAINPITLRDSYINVVLGYTPMDQLLAEQKVDVPVKTARRMSTLIEAQYYRQQMYSSSAFFFADLDSQTTRYGIANAAFAIKLTCQATGVDLAPTFRRDLGIVNGTSLRNGEPITGRDIYDELVEEMS